jgi:hypothetical protein
MKLRVSVGEAVDILRALALADSMLGMPSVYDLNDLSDKIAKQLDPCFPPEDLKKRRAK